jgi:hypothetical protein
VDGLADKGDKESSIVSAVPAGFFETSDKQRAKRTKKSESNEFDTFMQEISAMGAVKNNRDGTVVEVDEDPDHGRAHQLEQQGELREDEDSVDVSQEAYADDFEQFVRRERMKEVRQAVQNKTRPNDHESHHDMMAQISAVGSNNAVRLPEVSLVGRQSIVDSYNQIMQASDSVGSDSSDEDDWRAKKL